MATPSSGPAMTLRAELPRKLGHVAVGLCILLLRWFPAWLAAAGAAAAIILNAFYVHRLTKDVFLREGERDRRFSAGVLFYPVAVFALLVVFTHRLELAAAAWAMLAFGDAAAGLAGLALGGPALPWNPRKRWSGLIAFWVVGTITAALLLRWTQLGAPSPWIGRSYLTDAVAPWGGSGLWLWIACTKAAAAAALVESLDTGWEDNLLVAATAGTLLWIGTLVTPAALLDASPYLITGVLIGATITALPAAAARLVGVVGTGGALMGWLLTTLLYGAAEWPGLVVFGTFLVLSAGATRIGWKRKASLGIAQSEGTAGGRRGAANALANSVVGLCCAWLAALSDRPIFWAVAMTAAFATAAFDTVASEWGKAFGRVHILPTSLRRVAAGTAGAVSMEGTTAGLFAAAVVAGTAGALGSVTRAGGLAVVAGALVGSTAESVLGAVLPRGGAQRGDVLNVINTAIGTAVACGVYTALRS